MSGKFSGSIDIDPSANNVWLYGDEYLVKYDPLGNLVWGKSWTNYSIHSFSVNNNIIISGNGLADLNPGPNTNMAQNQFSIIELDANGNYLWSQDFNVDAVFNTSTRYDGTGNVIISGSILGDDGFNTFFSQDFDPGSTTIDIYSDQGLDGTNSSFYCAKYSILCQPIVNYLDSIVINEGDSVLIFGNYESNNNTYQQFYTAANGCDSIVMQRLIVVNANSLPFIENDNDLLTYPNPFNDYFTISYNRANQYKVSIFSLDGKLVYTKKINQKISNIFIEDLSPGLYIFELNDNGKIYTKKILKR